MIDTGFALARAQSETRINGNDGSGKHGEDFAAILRDAMRHGGAGTERIVDSLELSGPETNPERFSRDEPVRAVNRAADGENAVRESADATEDEHGEYRKVFHQFVGETLYGQMLKSMRQTQEKPAYFHGGRAEELFQGQLDQIVVEKMTRATSMNLSDAMFRHMPKTS